jgi:hypothetical protein
MLIRSEIILCLMRSSKRVSPPLSSDIRVSWTKAILKRTTQFKDLKILSCVGGTIYGVWIGDRIYCSV